MNRATVPSSSTCFCESIDFEIDLFELLAKTELLDPCRFSLLYIL
jgi:hypothetical protein